MASKSKIVSNSFFTFSVLLLFIMLLKSYIDYQNFIKHPEWSAPLSTHLLVTGITFCIPVFVALVLAIIFRYKEN
ncbi:hypothetical protein ACQKP0_13530 [Heyndrickxia sp. NPDC080065]|uniref:hypothetical protein n=1 Tax=Heyndrickxia sp. NPDC080065 TaxID=3390568 RepID=UPI003D074B37